MKSPDGVYFVISEGEVNMRYLDGAIARRLPNREIIEMLVS